MIVVAFLLAAASADPIRGTWEGTSLCQVKPSPCHDEHVIYRIKPTAARRYRIDAYKLVAGQEQFMGPVEVSFDPAARQLSGAVGRDRTMGQMRLTLRGTHMTGRMTLKDGSLFRLIDVTKR